MSAKIRVDGSYVYIHPVSHVPRTVEIRPDLHVDLAADGRVIGVENVAGPVTAADLASVLFALPLEEDTDPAARGLGINPETETP